MNSGYFLSAKGLAGLRVRYQDLLEELENSTRAMGRSAGIDNDLRENPEFMQLRTKISYELPKKLAALRTVLNSHILIEDMKEHMTDAPYEEVIPGTEVELTGVGGERRIYTILGFDESDPPKGVVSYLSPIGSALLDKQVGEFVRLPGGHPAAEYQIVSIRRSSALGPPASDRSQ